MAYAAAGRGRPSWRCCRLWAVLAGPLRGHLTRMDPLWASALAGKDYIFPSDWNASFWLVNLAYLGVAVADLSS